MHIISDFHDFYDTVQALGIDKQCPYIRKTQDSEHKLGRDIVHPSIGSKYSSKRHSYQVSYKLVGFCGKIWPVVVVSKSEDGRPDLKPNDSFFYDAEKLVSYLAKEKVWYTQHTSWWRKDHTLSEVNGIECFFDPDTWKHFLDYFQKHKVPIFILGSKHLILNPRLKSYGFQQMKDAYSAYQDLYMFISGVLGVETKPTIKISDKDMADSKGHGGKYSFKKPKGTKRSKPRWR